MNSRKEEIIDKYAGAVHRNRRAIADAPHSVILQHFHEFADEIAALSGSLPVLAPQLITSILAISEHFPPGSEHTIEHDGFRGRVIGYYHTEEGKPGVVLQLADARVVHVYGTRSLARARATLPGGDHG